MANNKLLITADDYGIFDPIDNGILEVADKIDCIDILVTHHTLEKRVKKLFKLFGDRIEKGELRLGLHLNLTCGSPQYTADKAYIRKIAKTRDSGRLEFRRNSAVTFIPYLDNLLRRCKTGLEKEIEAQYETFKRVTGREPYHVSSHEGVYSGHEKLYQLCASFCKRKGIPMRSPTLSNYITDDNFESWRVDHQQLLPPKLLNWMVLVDNGVQVRRWILRKAEGEYIEDLKKGETYGHDFFVEHFFKLGSYDRLVKLMKRVSETDMGTSKSFEMVVHPVKYKKEVELENVPKGINPKPLKVRVKEMEALQYADVKYLRDLYQLGDFPKG